VKFAYAEDRPVAACHGNGGWPPYHYLPQNSNNDSPMIGASLDLIDAIFAKMSQSYTVEAVPWLRCLVGAKAGKYELIVDGSFNKKRTENFYFSIPLYETTPTVFLQKTHPLTANAYISPSSLKQLKVCSDRGMNLTAFGLTKDEVAFTTDNVAHSFKLLKRNRCDAVPHLHEVVMGFPLMGQDLVENIVTPKLLASAEPVTFHILISKTSPRAALLEAEINQAIALLKAEGTYKEIFSKVIRPGNGS